MRYHFVVNGYADDVRKQMEEQSGFAEKFLSEMEQGEAFIYCQNTEHVQSLQAHHAKEAVWILAEEYVPEIVLDALCSRAEADSLYIFGSDDSGIELAVRMAARLSGSSVTGAEKLQVRKGEQPAQEGACTERIYVSKMVYASHMEAVFAMERGPYCISLARGGERQELSPGGFAVKEETACKNGAEYIVSQQFYPEDAKDGLAQAKVILAAGRGIQKKENMEAIDAAAQSLGAQTAVSRPAAMNAWKPMNRLLGVSGVLAAPEICITAGVSGAAAFYAGIEKSRFIAAINTDEKAPIMKMADAAIVDDCLPVIEELRRLHEQKSGR